MALDKNTLRQIDAWLTELAAEAERLPAREWNTDTAPTSTAHSVGVWKGIQDARAFIDAKVAEERVKQGVE